MTVSTDAISSLPEGVFFVFGDRFHFFDERNDLPLYGNSSFPSFVNVIPRLWRWKSCVFNSCSKLLNARRHVRLHIIQMLRSFIDAPEIGDGFKNE